MADTKEMNIKQFEAIMNFALDPLDFLPVVDAFPSIARELSTKNFKSPVPNKCPVRAALYHNLDTKRFKSCGVEVAFHLNRVSMNEPDKILDYHWFKWEVIKPELRCPDALAELDMAFREAATNYILQRSETEIQRIRDRTEGSMWWIDERTRFFC